MSTRSTTVFYTNTDFLAELNKFDVSVGAAITAHMLRFEKAWQASKHDGDLPAGFCFEAYHDIDGPYRLCQIRVGPKHGYRVTILFVDRGSDAYWVSIFKKVKDRQPEDMERACVRAQQIWDSYKGAT